MLQRMPATDTKRNPDPRYAPCMAGLNSLRSEILQLSGVSVNGAKKCSALFLHSGAGFCPYTGNYTDYNSFRGGS